MDRFSGGAGYVSSVMAKVPNGSAVVFILGEIDCREGILVAVEKLRYKTAEEGIEHTVGIFIKVAEALSRERGLRIFVHPVIPVLDETRGMVKTYNRVFRRMVDKSKHLHWLDFFEQLLDDTGSSLRPNFRLDGIWRGGGSNMSYGRVDGGLALECRCCWP
ncbi:unnamed protein product [Ectocarpus sp. 13 AM-2016]